LGALTGWTECKHLVGLEELTVDHGALRVNDSLGTMTEPSEKIDMDWSGVTDAEVSDGYAFQYVRSTGVEEKRHTLPDGQRLEVIYQGASNVSCMFSVYLLNCVRAACEPNVPSYACCHLENANRAVRTLAVSQQSDNHVLESVARAVRTFCCALTERQSAASGVCAWQRACSMVLAGGLTDGSHCWSKTHTPH
jgi:hypothetical protein